MENSKLWENSDFTLAELADYGAPRGLIELMPDGDCGQVAAVAQGGCESGAYMPAVTYGTAAEYMSNTVNAETVYQCLCEHGRVIDLSGLPDWYDVCVALYSNAVDISCAVYAQELEVSVMAYLDDQDSGCSE